MISVYIPFHGATASPISTGTAFRTPFSGQRMSPRRYWKPVQTPSWRKRKTHFQFQILHADGVLVQYSLDVSLTELWAMVEPTLPGA